MSAVGLDGTWLRASWLKRGLTVGAERALVGRSLAPVGGGRGEGGILEHLGAEASKAFVDSGFDLGESGFGMLEAPFVDAAENIVAQVAPVLVEVGLAHIASLVEVRTSILRCHGFICNPPRETMTDTPCTMGCINTEQDTHAR